MANSRESPANIEYSQTRPISAEELADCFRRSGIRRPVDDLPRIEKMIRNANLIIGAWRGAKLIGVARALTDFSFCCYLSDLTVDRDFQRLGIGKELIRLLRRQTGDQVTLLLLAAPEAAEYYPHIGFDKVENAWRLPPENEPKREPQV